MGDFASPQLDKHVAVDAIRLVPFLIARSRLWELPPLPGLRIGVRIGVRLELRIEDARQSI